YGELRDLGRALPGRIHRAGVDEPDPAVHFLDALLVGVSVEADVDSREVASQELRVLPEMLGARHVLLDVAHATMGQEELPLYDDVRGKPAKVLRLHATQGVSRALERMHGLVRAALESQATGADEIVVAGDAGYVARAQDAHALVGVGVVADDVAQAEKPIDTDRVDGRQRRLERLPVAVDVA